MRAIILAAGRGSRMGSITEDSPKCLTQIAGQSLLRWQIRALRQEGINQIAIVRGYMANKISDPDCVIFENPNWSTSNMVKSLTYAATWLAESNCIISYSDIVYHPKIVRELINTTSNLAITYDQEWLPLWSSRFDDPLQDAETFQLTPDRKLKSIGNRAKSITDIEGQYMGLLKLSPIGWEQILLVLNSLPPCQADTLEMTSLLQLLVESGIKIEAVPISGRWCEIDNQSDLKVYETRLNSEKWLHDWRW